MAEKKYKIALDAVREGPLEAYQCLPAVKLVLSKDAVLPSFGNFFLVDS